LQVKPFFPTRFQFAVLIVCGGALLAPVAGCHRSPAPDVMATVNGKEILRSELERKYQDYKLSQGGTPQEPSAEQAQIVRLGVLRQMIDEEILQQRAAKLTVTASDEDVNDKLTEMKARFITQEDFDKQLKLRNQTLDDLKRDIRSDLTETKLLNKEIEAKINITDAEIASFYNSHKAEFNFIEPRYNLARIVATSAPSPQAGNLQNSKATSDADAKKKIQALHSNLENGNDFGSVAMNFSEDKDTASSGGDMGFVFESQLRTDPDVYNAIAKLKPGQITDVLPVYDSAAPGRHVIGYAIYKLISWEPAGQRQLNDPRVQQGIHTVLHESHAQLLKNAYFEMLHNEAKIHNYLADQIFNEGTK
jgi:peptidyl-prolyl cis-trans isomerase SurA